MEKRLRSSLQTSPESFLSAAAKLSLNKKSSKANLKSLIFSITHSSHLSSSLLISLHCSISKSIHHLLEASSTPPHSPPPKRLRRSSRTSSEPEPKPEPRQQTLLDLHIFAYICLLCTTHPKQAFSATDLFPAVQLLHDNLILCESDSVLSSEIANLCEEWWKGDFPGREMLISQTLPFLLSRSLTLKKKVDVHRVYALREAFNLLDFEDESIDDLKMLLIRCVIAPLYLKTEEGRKFVAFLCGLSMQVLKEALAMIKSQIAFGRKSMLEAYGDILFRAWKGVEGDLKMEIEDGFMQMLIEGAVHASSSEFASSIRRVLGGFLNQRTIAGVDKMLFRLAQPVIFRSLQVANSHVRQNALYLLLDLFPVEDPDSTKEEKDSLLHKQFFLLERLLMDDCPDVRVVAVEGCCRVLHLFWEIIPSSTITKILTKIFDDMSHDTCSEVRLSTVNGIIYLLGNPLSHEILKVLLPRLGHLMLDKVLSIRVAFSDLLLLIRGFRSFQFNKVVGLDVLLSALANDQPQVAQKLTRLLMPSYFPSRVTVEEACNRCVTLLKRSPVAGARFCQFAVSEGASHKPLMELLRVFISLVLSNDKLEADQVENMIVAASHLCENLVSETNYQTALKELFSSETLKCLFATSSAGHAQASVLNIVSTISPHDVTVLLKECKSIITNCTGLPKNVEMQAELRSAYKLLLRCGHFDGMFEVLTSFLQKTAYRCHIKFGTELPQQNITSEKMKTCNSTKNAAKWKHVSGKRSSSFEEDYSVAVGMAWQIKDLLISEESRKAILESESLKMLFLALKVISEVSILQCLQCEFMDPFPVLTYASLALHMTLENVGISGHNNCGSKKNDRPDSSRSVLEASGVFQCTVLSHLLNCAEKLLLADDPGKSGKIPSDSKQDDNKMTRHRRQKQRETQTYGSSSCDDGSGCARERRILNKVKMLTAVLKVIVDAHTMDLASLNSGKCIRFTSAFVQNIISTLCQHSSDQIQIQEELIACLKSSLTYAAKLLAVTLRNTDDTSPPPPESFHLANGLLDLIASTELYLGSGYAARLVMATNPWLPDLILALGSGCMLKQTQGEGTYKCTFDHIKLHFPLWLSILAKIELCELSKVSLEEGDNRVSEPIEFSAFKRLVDMIVLLLKRNSSILDAVGMIFLVGSVVGLERKDFELVLGLVHFVRMNLTGCEDREWTGFDMMLASLPDIYPLLEREIEEQTSEDEKQKLHNIRALLEPVWLYHVYETGRFSVMEE